MNTSAGVLMPRMIYETALQRDRTEAVVMRTEDLAELAIREGFWGLDTAGQPSHYYEPGVGIALRNLFRAGYQRESVFIQTKVCPRFMQQLVRNEYSGDSDVPISKQVAFSIANSLSNLGLEYVDSLLLHWPYSEHEQTMEAWRAMEEAHKAGIVRQLGISNIDSLEQLQRIYNDSNVKPAVVMLSETFEQEWYQSRPRFELRKLERKLRKWCSRMKIFFQRPLMITTNRDPVWTRQMRGLADKYGVSQPQLFLRYAMGMGTVPLIGSADPNRWRQDFEAMHIELERGDAWLIKNLVNEAIIRSERRHDEHQMRIVKSRERAEARSIDDTGEADALTAEEDERELAEEEIREEAPPSDRREQER